MNRIKFRRLFRVFTFSLFGSLTGLAIIGIPSVDLTAVSVMIIFGLGLCLLYFIWKRVRPEKFKARIIEKIIGNNEFGQRCHAVEINEMLLPEITWLPVCNGQTVEIRDIIPYNKMLTVRLTIMEFGKLSRLYIIMCGQPPHVHNNVYS